MEYQWLPNFPVPKFSAAINCSFVTGLVEVQLWHHQTDIVNTFHFNISSHQIPKSKLVVHVIYWAGQSHHCILAVTLRSVAPSSISGKSGPHGNFLRDIPPGRKDIYDIYGYIYIYTYYIHFLCNWNISTWRLPHIYIHISTLIRNHGSGTLLSDHLPKEW